ncbi:hypothetical protein BJX68DRAFT_263366 [Aspergillus pseudodeflectus]|uniref:Uncharacterized protein n=1 Tax=Aspergillus pseudodeflectus TaxID=176178 RepID=A0ABR4KX39_9EURO
MSQSSNPRPTPTKYAPIGAYGIGFVEGPTGHLHKAAGQVLTILHCTRLIEVTPETASAASSFKPAGLGHLNLVLKTRAGHGAHILPKGDVDIVGECSFGYWTDDEGCLRLGYGRVVRVWREFSVRIVDPFKGPGLFEGPELDAGALEALDEEALAARRRVNRTARVCSEKGDVYRIDLFS